MPAEAFIVSRPDQFELDSAYIVRAVKQARGRSESVLLAHSHPGDPFLPCFSLADDRGEQKLYPLLHARVPNRRHGAVVLFPGGVTARLVEPDSVAYAATVRIVGRQSQTFAPAPARAETLHLVSGPLRTRQELMWGFHGQGLLRGLTVGVVGAGGTGSLVAQQLIHLGIGHLIVVDPQILEPGN